MSDQLPFIQVGVNTSGSCKAVVHHLLHGSGSNVVRTGRSVNGNRPKLTPYRTETPCSIKIKLNTIHYVFAGTPHRIKLIISRSKGPRPQRVNV
jgi:hypothetical protein